MHSRKTMVGRSTLYLGVMVLGAFATAAHAQSTSNCAPYPAFPDENCTGWKHTGVTLTPYSGPTTITTAGTVIDGKEINSSLVIAANNVTIRRSQVNGIIETNGSASGLLIEDVKIDGRNSMWQCVGRSSNGVNSRGFTVRRSEITGCAQGVYASNFTLEDSYIHGLYGSGTVHSEAILGLQGNIVVRHNRIIGDYRQEGSWDPNDGGMSSAVSFYTHSSFWPDINNVTFEKNFLGTGASGRGQAGFCLYGGGSDDGGNTSNGIFRDNVFDRGSSGKCGRHGPVTWVATGPGSCWSNNRYEDGTAISGAAPACSGGSTPAPKIPAPPSSITVQ